MFYQEDGLFDCLFDLISSILFTTSLEGVSSQPGVVGTVAQKGGDKEKRPAT